jgi:uncharacterized membrane protein
MQKGEDIKYELEVLKRLYENASIESESHQRHIDLTSGVTLGLLYGIVGNLFVQFLYPVVERITTMNIDNIFWVDLGVSIIIFVSIVITTYKLRSRLAEHKKGEQEMQANMKNLEEAIKRREHDLMEFEKLEKAREEMEKLSNKWRGVNLGQ